MKKSSKSRLTPYQLSRFNGDTLFDKIARAVCKAGSLPTKELHEAWEVARRVRRKFRGGRIVDFACGHGLLGHIMLLLDDSSEQAMCVDQAIPANAATLSNSLLAAWPRLKGRIQYCQTSIETFALTPNDVVLSIHGCGRITDLVLKRAIQANARVAVLPCCHDLGRSDTGGLDGWMDGPLAVDTMRAVHLGAAGYEVLTRTIPSEITPKNRLLMGFKDEA